MPNVTINPINSINVRINQGGPKVVTNDNNASGNNVNSINVRINQGGPKVVTGATTFVGSADVQQQVDAIAIVAQNASDTANLALSQVSSAFIASQNAYNAANNKLDLTGGTIAGNLVVTGIITANNEILDAGTF